MLKTKTNCLNFLDKIEKNANIAIWGTGEIASYIFDAVKTQRNDVNIAFFINQTKEKDFKNTKVYSFLEAKNYFSQLDCVIIASYSSRYYMEFVLELSEVKNIIMPDIELFKKCVNVFDVNESASVFTFEQDRTLYKNIAMVREKELDPCWLRKYYRDKNYKIIAKNTDLSQYMEFINQDAIKILIEGGGNDGLNTLNFIKNFKNIETIYMFEPCYEEFKNEIYDSFISKNEKIKIVKKALYKQKDVLDFKMAQYNEASSFSYARPDMPYEHKTIKVECTTLDDFVKEKNIKKVDMIKMDIENAEYDALLGAQKTIIKDRPQMAISIYHSKEHFYKIPLFLNELLENYTFRLGHYCENKCDTLLYAIPNELLR